MAAAPPCGPKSPRTSSSGSGCAAPSERAPPAGLALVARAQVGRAADAGDAAVAEREQVRGRDLAAARVVDLDQVGGDRFDLAVEQHERQAQPAAVLDDLRVVAGGDQHQAVDAALREHAQMAGLALGLVVGVAQQQVVARGVAAMLDAADDLREVGIRVAGHQHAERAGRVLLQPARDLARDVAERMRGLLDLRARRVADEARAVQRVRNRRHRHAGALGASCRRMLARPASRARGRGGGAFMRCFRISGWPSCAARARCRAPRRG